MSERVNINWTATVTVEKLSSLLTAFEKKLLASKSLALCDLSCRPLASRPDVLLPTHYEYHRHHQSLIHNIKLKLRFYKP